jgi:hypothetical protein
MPNSGKPDINASIAAWADICIKIWQANITKEKIYSTGDLFNSLSNSLYRNSGGDVEKIEFIFNLYGIYVDAGVGGGTAGNKSWLSDDQYQFNRNTDRRRRQWFSRTFFGQVMKLREILAEKYGQELTYQVTETVKGANVEFI